MAQTSAAPGPLRKLTGRLSCCVVAAMFFISVSCSEQPAPKTFVPPSAALTTTPAAPASTPQAKTVVPPPAAPSPLFSQRTPTPPSPSSPGSTAAPAAPPLPSPSSPAAAEALKITEPANESILSSSPVRVSGAAALDAVVSVNGRIAPLGDNGRFAMSVPLLEGPNVLEVIATHADGDQSSQILTVIYIP